MGLYLNHQNSSHMTWLAINAEPVSLTLENKLALFPWNSKSDKILLAYLAGPIECIAVMYSEDEFKRFQTSRPDARWFSADKALVEKLS